MERGRDEDGAGSASLPSPGDGGWGLDIFLSFRGEDIRKSFTGHLYRVLRDKGIRTFIDDKELEKDQRVEGLFGYIERLNICVPIFSKGYADSKWCLKEIAKIAECGRTIISAFFGGEPPAIQNQRGPFHSAFEKHEKNEELNREEVKKWKDALRKVGEISGYNPKDTNWNEADLVQLILERIKNILNRTGPHVADHPVGLDSPANEVAELLKIESDGVRMIGICGIGGMGKITLGKAVYKRLFSSFEACCFLASVWEESKQHSGVVTLQKQLLLNVLGSEMHINNRDEGIALIKTRIGCKKVLVVIDNVDHKDQFEALAASRGHPKKGRIIITFKNERVLNVNQHVIYKLAKVDAAQSLQLFSWHAVGKCEPKLGY